MTQVKQHGEINAAAKLIADWRSMMIVHAIYEHGPLRYKTLSGMLQLSPTILSGKLQQLSDTGIVFRTQEPGAKEVVYQTAPIAKGMVKAYHLLEVVNDDLRGRAS